MRSVADEFSTLISIYLHFQSDPYPNDSDPPGKSHRSESLDYSYGDEWGEVIGDMLGNRIFGIIQTQSNIMQIHFYNQV